MTGCRVIGALFILGSLIISAVPVSPHLCQPQAGTESALSTLDVCSSLQADQCENPSLATGHILEIPLFPLESPLFGEQVALRIPSAETAIEMPPRA